MPILLMCKRVGNAWQLYLHDWFEIVKNVIKLLYCEEFNNNF
jgi:hypothetical protein